MENQVPVPPQPQQPQDSDSRPPVPPQYNQYYQSQPVQGQPWFSQQGSQPAAPQQGTPVQPVSPQPQQGAPVQPVVPQYQQGVPMQPAMQQSQQQWGQQPVCQVPPTPQPMPIQQPAPMPQPVQGQLAPMPQPMPVQQPMPQPAPLQQPLPRAIPTPLTGPERHKVHHSYIWLGSLQLVFAMFVAVVVSSMSIFSELNFSSSGGGEGFVALLSIGGLALVLLITAVASFLWQWLSYKHLWYEFGDEEFNLYSGILNKKRVHVPYRRIQSVDQRSTLLQRIFGVCTVNIDTAGGAQNRAVRVPYIQKSQAEILRAEVFTRKQFIESGADPKTFPGIAALGAFSQTGIPQAGMPIPQPGAAASQGQPQAYQQASFPGQPQTPGQPQASGNILDAPAEVWQDVRGIFGGMEVNTGKVTYEHGLSNKELIFTGLSNNTMFILLVLGLIGLISQFFTYLAPLFFGSEEQAYDSLVATAVAVTGGNIIAIVAGGLLAAFAVLWVMSAVASCLAYGGFKARRRGTRIEVERGLLQHTFQGVDVDRVQSVIIKQSFIRRMIGYCELSLGKIDAMVSDSSDNQQSSSLSTGRVVIHPFVKVNRVPEILEGLIPEFSEVPQGEEVKKVAPVALRRAIIRRSIWQGNGFWLAIITTTLFWGIFKIIFTEEGAAGVSASSGLTLEGATSAESIMFMVDMFALSLYAISVLLFVLDIIGAVLWFKGSSFGYNRKFMQISNGGFSRTSVTFPRQKIQFGYTKTNPFQRLAKTATVFARSAAGLGGTTAYLIDVTEDDAALWLEWLKPRRAKNS